jgi:hypothetical protein
VNEELITKMADAITDFPTEKLASFHGRFLAYLGAGLSEELGALDWVGFADCDAQALNRVWMARRG